MGYIREIETQEAKRLLGSQARVAANSKLFCLYNADGTPSYDGFQMNLGWKF